MYIRAKEKQKKTREISSVCDLETFMYIRGKKIRNRKNECVCDKWQGN